MNKQNSSVMSKRKLFIPCVMGSYFKIDVCVCDDYVIILEMSIDKQVTSYETAAVNMNYLRSSLTVTL